MHDTLVKVIAWYDNEWGYSSACRGFDRSFGRDGRYANGSGDQESLSTGQNTTHLLKSRLNA